jgi:hypothetical protein
MREKNKKKKKQKKKTKKQQEKKEQLKVRSSTKTASIDLFNVPLIDCSFMLLSRVTEH